MSDRLTLSEIVNGLKDDQMRTALLDEFGSAWEKVPEKDRKELAENLGVLGASIGTRWYLRRIGATKLQGYIAASALTSLGVISLRLKKLIAAVEAQQGTVNVSNTFPSSERVSSPMTEADLKIRGL